MDIWLKPDNMNKNLFAAFLKQKEFNTQSLNQILGLDFTKANSFHLGKDETKIDFLTNISGVTYDDAENQQVLLPLGKIKIPVIHYHHLITNKMMSDRLKDKADVEELQKINQFKSKK